MGVRNEQEKQEHSVNRLIHEEKEEEDIVLFEFELRALLYSEAAEAARYSRESALEADEAAEAVEAARFQFIEAVEIAKDTGDADEYNAAGNFVNAPYKSSNAVCAARFILIRAIGVSVIARRKVDEADEAAEAAIGAYYEVLDAGDEYNLEMST